MNPITKFLDWLTGILIARRARREGAVDYSDEVSDDYFDALKELAERMPRIDSLEPI